MLEYCNRILKVSFGALGMAFLEKKCGNVEKNSRNEVEECKQEKRKRTNNSCIPPFNLNWKCKILIILKDFQNIFFLFFFQSRVMSEI